MIFSARALVSAVLLTAALPALAVIQHRKPTTTHTTSTHSTAHTTHTSAHTTSHSTSHSTKRGAHLSRTSAHAKPTHAFAHVAMTTERATQIQSALIKQGYLTGEPTGNWDAVSIAAMQKLQSDNGWQTKIMPDSRALIKLGLGPNSQGPTE